MKLYPSEQTAGNWKRKMESFHLPLRWCVDGFPEDLVKRSFIARLVVFMEVVFVNVGSCEVEPMSKRWPWITYGSIDWPPSLVTDLLCVLFLAQLVRQPASFATWWIADCDGCPESVKLRVHTLAHWCTQLIKGNTDSCSRRWSHLQLEVTVREYLGLVWNIENRYLHVLCPTEVTISLHFCICLLFTMSKTKRNRQVDWSERSKPWIPSRWR